jgi:lysophospholipase L1-like esterase
MKTKIVRMFTGTRGWPCVFCLWCVALCAVPAVSAVSFAPSPQTDGIANAETLTRFFQALAESRARSRAEPVRILHFGDSHTAADILTAIIRNNLQRDFRDGGAGYLVPGNPFATRRNGVASSVSRGWFFDGIARKGGANDGFYGLAGFSLSAYRANETIILRAPATRFTIFYLQRPGGGRLEIRADGVAAPEPIATAATAPAGGYYAVDFPPGLHSLQIRTLDNAPVRILGLVAEHHAAPGVSYDVLGINGARLKRFQTWNAALLNDNLRQRQPDLVILAYGTNEIADPDWTPEGYTRLLASVIRQIRAAAPEAAILLYSPPERADNAVSVQRGPALAAAQQRAALENGAAFWNGYEKMGPMSNLIANRLGLKDRVHLSGLGYQRFGALFYADLLAAYNATQMAPRRRP